MCLALCWTLELDQTFPCTLTSFLLSLWRVGIVFRQASVLMHFRNIYLNSQVLWREHLETTVQLNRNFLKIWSSLGSDYEECRLLGYKNTVRTSQGTHYVSTTESSQLMLCKIWRFHGGDYEECRLLGYKNTVRTSPETHYLSATESSQLMLCKIWSSHGSDYEECRLLGYKNTVRTSREIHYLSATEPSQLMPCKIWGFHSSDYEECSRLGYKSQLIPHRKHITSLKNGAFRDVTPCGSCKNRRFGGT
jgi:hypothetical protein